MATREELLAHTFVEFADTLVDDSDVIELRQPDLLARSGSVVGTSFEILTAASHLTPPGPPPGWRRVEPPGADSVVAQYGREWRVAAWLDRP